MVLVGLRSRSCDADQGRGRRPGDGAPRPRFSVGAWPLEPDRRVAIARRRARASGRWRRRSLARARSCSGRRRERLASSAQTAVSRRHSPRSSSIPRLHAWYRGGRPRLSRRGARDGPAPDVPFSVLDVDLVELSRDFRLYSWVKRVGQVERITRTGSSSTSNTARPWRGRPCRANRASRCSTTTGSSFPRTDVDPEAVEPLDPDQRQRLDPPFEPRPGRVWSSGEGKARRTRPGRRQARGVPRVGPGPRPEDPVPAAFNRRSIHAALAIRRTACTSRTASEPWSTGAIRPAPNGPEN